MTCAKLGTLSPGRLLHRWSASGHWTVYVLSADWGGSIQEIEEELKKNKDEKNLRREYSKHAKKHLKIQGIWASVEDTTKKIVKIPTYIHSFPNEET